MTSVSVRQSGGAKIVSIPTAIVRALGLDTGSKLDLQIEDNKIVLTPVTEEALTLEDLIKGSPKKCFKITDEDKEWLYTQPVGKEL
ncbi:MAG: AbrB/MazE/SpoVT family DNA-binding domain-containing protein [Cellvibrionaceae bacterium]|nr:AbrB/MazE/SpoVT family DNA-binding domain-containing protein [Cellvibrionaceae bacterium]